MSKEKIDRRVQRTRQLLESALMELIEEKGYDAITIQDITERANLGRTTFYTHLESKEALFLSSHQVMVRSMSNGFFAGGDLLNPDRKALVGHLETIQQNRAMYHNITRGSGADIIIRGIREQLATDLETRLKEMFDEQNSSLPFQVLANYLAGAQLSLVSWWIEKRIAHTADDIAGMLYQLQKAAIEDAIGSANSSKMNKTD
jgi:AcrR family transcriptional regulator